MFGIVLTNVINAGGIIGDSAVGVSTINYWLIEILYIISRCSVDIFAIISGCVGIYKKRRSSYRFIELILIVFIYSIIITGIFIVTNLGGKLSFIDIIKGLVPGFFGRYWYITCFIPILILQPYINKMILSLDKKVILIYV